MMTARSAHSVGVVAVRLLVVSMVALALTSCGEESAEPASAEFCDAAMPLFDLQASRLVQEEQTSVSWDPSEKSRTSASDALTRLASLSEGDAARKLLEMAEGAKDGALFPTDLQPLLVGCAGATLNIVVSESGIDDITSPIPAGIVATAVSNDGETTAYGVSPIGKDDGVQEFLDDVESETVEPPAFFQTTAKDGSVSVFRLEAGRYAVSAFTSTGLDSHAAAPIPGAEFVRIIDVE